MSMDPIVLKPNDRVIFGTSSVFLFRNKDKEEPGQEVVDTPDNPVTYEFAMKELKKTQDAELEKQREEDRLKAEAEAAKKMEELKAKMDAEKAEQEAAALKMKEEMEAQMRKLQEEIAAK